MTSGALSDGGWVAWVARSVGDPSRFDFAIDLLMDHRISAEVRMSVLELVEEHLPDRDVDLLVNFVLLEIRSPQTDARIRAFLRGRPRWEFLAER